MRRLLFLALALCLLVSTGCRNWIKEEGATIFDVVPGTEKISINQSPLEGAVYNLGIKFVAKKRQYDIMNDSYTPYSGVHELYEVPVGLVGVPFSLVWYLVTGLMPVEDSTSRGPSYWSWAGLNPFLNVEQGMFVNRVPKSAERPGSRAAHKGSKKEPISASVEPLEKFVYVGTSKDDMIKVPVLGDIRMRINLLWIAPLLETPQDSTGKKIVFKVNFKWNNESDKIYVKESDLFISYKLTKKLWNVSNQVRVLLDPKATPEATKEAFDTIGLAGFSSEAAMAKDQIEFMRK